MPDLSDVENVLVSLIAQIVYPDGTDADSITGGKVKVFRGWPLPSNLDSDLKAGTVNISVFPLAVEQNVTRFSTDWQEIPAPPVTLTMAISGQTVEIGGRPCCPLNAAVLVDGKAFVHPLQATDTPTSIATALATLISTVTPATSNGPVITVPGATKLEARLGSVGNIVQELKRQKQSFRISIWCSRPLVRDAIATALDPALASLDDIALTDGTAGRMRYVKSETIDGGQKAGLYRRDLVYSVEYGTTITRRAAAIVAQQVDISGGTDPAAPELKNLTI